MASKALYRYSPLPVGQENIRLLRILPNKDRTEAIHCQLIDYSLALNKGSHLYEALSYVWGNPNETIPIFIDGYVLPVTSNLHAALLRLRNRVFERILWVDAICIDQENDLEKEQQIRFMADIYGQAQCVVVWLGETADNSDLALEAIRIAGGLKPREYLEGAGVQEAVLSLFQRPWFRRIWVRSRFLDVRKSD